MAETEQYRHVSRRERRIRRRLRGAAVVACIPLVFVMAALSIELVEYHPTQSSEPVALVEAEALDTEDAMDRAEELRLQDASLLQYRQQLRERNASLLEYRPGQELDSLLNLPTASMDSPTAEGDAQFLIPLATPPILANRD